MNVFMRGAVRRTTVGLGALALAAGAAACGGGGEQEPAPQDPGVEEPAGEEGGGGASDAGGEQPDEPSDGGGMFDGGEDPAGSGASDDGGEDAETESELSEEEIGAATERFVEFLQAVDDHDAETACSMLLNPETGETGDEIPECVEVFEQDVMPQVEGGEYQDLDASMVDPEDNGDGTVTINLDGSAFPLPMGQGDDGAWYVTASV